MMPPEEPDTGSYKIVFEIDYSHFVKLHGYLFGLQVVNKSLSFLLKRKQRLMTRIDLFICSLCVFSFLEFCLLLAALLRPFQLKSTF